MGSKARGPSRGIEREHTYVKRIVFEEGEKSRGLG
jgi:hypothetical protein